MFVNYIYVYICIYNIYICITTTYNICYINYGWNRSYVHIGIVGVSCVCYAAMVDGMMGSVPGHKLALFSPALNSLERAMETEKDRERHRYGREHLGRDTVAALAVCCFTSSFRCSFRAC